MEYSIIQRKMATVFLMGLWEDPVNENWEQTQNRNKLQLYPQGLLNPGAVLNCDNLSNMC